MSSELAISTTSLSKAYAISRGRARATTLAEVVARRVRAPRYAAHADEFWALRDVTLDVRSGEVLGILGRNGAGKSTLLKILSRITEPTSGEAQVWGRVGSLLEVGTGFHPELTGRENIYLNGAILGMKRASIARRFDDIVAFAEIDAFLDTPVKRYSSGMHMRLAFSVAAHLEPEVLVVDEVLAVGDAEFQRRCLSKMSGVAQSGRTILFVSHNLAAVRLLCNRGILLEKGRIVYDGGIEDTIDAYQACFESDRRDEWRRGSEDDRRPLSFERVRVHLQGDQPRHRLLLEMDLRSRGAHAPAFVAADVLDRMGASIMQAVPRPTGFLGAKAGRYRLAVSIDLPPMIPGDYAVAVWAGSHNTQTLDEVRNCVQFTITASPTPGRTFPHSSDHGFVAPESRVEMLETEE